MARWDLFEKYRLHLHCAIGHQHSAPIRRLETEGLGPVLRGGDVHPEERVVVGVEHARLDLVRVAGHLTREGEGDGIGEKKSVVVGSRWFGEIRRATETFAFGVARVVARERLRPRAAWGRTTADMQFSSTLSAAISASLAFQNSSSVLDDTFSITCLVSSGSSSSSRHSWSRSSSPSAIASMHCSMMRSAVSSLVFASQSTSLADAFPSARGTRMAPRRAARERTRAADAWTTGAGATRARMAMVTTGMFVS